MKEKIPIFKCCSVQQSCNELVFAAASDVVVYTSSPVIAQQEKLQLNKESYSDNILQ